jgi:hypothetical protein
MLYGRLTDEELRALRLQTGLDSRPWLFLPTPRRTRRVKYATVFCLVAVLVALMVYGNSKSGEVAAVCVMPLGLTVINVWIALQCRRGGTTASREVLGLLLLTWATFNFFRKLTPRDSDLA